MSIPCRGLSWREDQNATISALAYELGPRLISLAWDVPSDADEPADILDLTAELANLTQLLTERVLGDTRLFPNATKDNRS